MSNSYLTGVEKNDVHFDREDPLAEEQNFRFISYTAIPYPLPVHLRQLHDEHERGTLEIPAMTAH